MTRGAARFRPPSGDIPWPGLLEFNQSNPQACVNAAYATWIAHEYGHFVAFHLLGFDIPEISGPFGEGFCDTMAQLIYDTDFFGHDFTGCGMHQREPRVLDPNNEPLRTYPVCPKLFTPCDDKYCVGELLSAVWLDILDQMRLAYGVEEGWDRTRSLHLGWIYIAQPPGTALCSGKPRTQAASASTLVEVLSVDSPDGVLANAPHLDQICAAFDNRGIFHEVCEEHARPARSADCNGDMKLDILDFLCFQDAFENELPYADCDGDTTLGALDFVCFQDQFMRAARHR